MKQGQFPAIIQLADLNGQNGFKIDGENPGDISGNSVSLTGDINQDGYADIVIGAPGYQSFTGRSYVIFGKSNIGNGGLIPLSSLNGNNGFKLDGEVVNDLSGFTVHTGDINGDGISDLLIGAYNHNNGMGRGYVLFGKKSIGTGGILPLSSLDGTNGFKLDGETNGDASSFSLSALGDVNGDHYIDLLIGAHGYLMSSGVGRTYLVFGSPGIGAGGLIALSSLNGKNGFKVDGEFVGDYSGYAVSLGDLNNDGYSDLLIGAWGYQNRTGRCYVVFGNRDIGNGGLIALSSLNGINGFKLNGEMSGDSTGYSISGVADINGDSYPDLLINSNYENTAYVVFGSAIIGRSSQIDLGSLDGVNGFKIKSEPGSGGHAVSDAGDINGDGYHDLIIGWGTGEGNGRVYVIFGSAQIGSSGTFLLSDLNGSNGFKLDGETADSQTGVSVSGVGDCNGDGIADIIIGANTFNVRTGRSYVVFGDAPPELINNTLWIYPGASLLISSSDLAATDKNHDKNSLVFVPSEVTHGRFERVSQSGVSAVNFTQKEISSAQIRFVHDGSSTLPGYQITVRSSGIAWTGPQAATVNFVTPPRLEHAFLKINPPEEIQLTTDNLLAIDDRTQPDDLIFSISQIKNGYFTSTHEWGTSIVDFIQQDILDGRIYFVAEYPQLPAFMVSVSNGWLSCTGCPKAADVVGPEDDSPHAWLTILSTLGSLIGIPVLKVIIENCLKRRFFSQFGNTPAELITRQILEKLWIGICSLVTQDQYRSYILAVAPIVTELHLDINRWNNDGRYQLNVMSAVATATEEKFVRCSNPIYRFFSGFCYSEASPEEIEQESVGIARRANQIMQNVGLFAHPQHAVPAYQPPPYQPGVINVHQNF